MGENNKTHKLKPCPVCILFEDDKDLSIKVNILLKTTDKITPKIEPLITNLIVSKNIKTPSAYNLNKHKNDCLKDFEYIETDDTLKNQDPELFIDMDSFRKTTLIEKDAIYQNLIHEIFYKKLVILSQDKKVSKDEINSLKSLYDLININNVDVSDTDFSSVRNIGDIEKITLGLINKIMSRGMISTNNIISIIGSLFKADYKEHLNNSTSIRETRESLMEKIERIQKVIDYAKSQEQLNDTVLDTNL